MNKLLNLNRITDAQNLQVSRYFGNAMLCVSKKCERSKDGLCGGLKILRCWFDTNRSHGCRFDSCGGAAVGKFNSYQAIGHVVCQPIKVGVAVASHFLLHTTSGYTIKTFAYTTNNLVINLKKYGTFNIYALDTFISDNLCNSTLYKVFNSAN